MAKTTTKATKLVIVESPSKSKTIEKYLGADYQVLSSKGHIRELSKSGKGRLGIDIENGFIPSYKDDPEKKEVISQLKKAAKNKEVYLATDPDREGEAISWHLAQILKLDTSLTNRVVFNEITKKAVTEAFNHPSSIDMGLVHSQETRRMLDRIIGFRLSSLLQRKIKSKSAGRVQSVALKLIVDRQKEIDAFIPEEYYTIDAKFIKDNQDFDAKLSKYLGEKVEIKTNEQAQEILNKLSDQFEVSQIVKKPTKTQSKLPFITSTLQQEASAKLGFNAKKTMMVAQQLYEGIDLKTEVVGLISYMRTDSYRLSDDFKNEAMAYIKETYGDQYIGTPKYRKPKGNVQDAHEAIRPTNVLYTPLSIKKNLSADQYKLYSLIYCRALASLMADSLKDSTSLTLTNNNYEFSASGAVMTFDGYKKVYGKYETSKDSVLPAFNENEQIKANSVEAIQHFTKGPASYNESSLIKELEELGIGRPSTYATIIDTLKVRKYVSLEDKKFIPTEQGILTTASLEENFSEIINVEYSAHMEDDLDKIAHNEITSVDVLAPFYDKFMHLYDIANESMEKIPDVKTGEKCPLCGNDLVIKKGRYGEFVACSDYPNCKYIKKEEKQVEYTGEDCPKCGSPMVKRYSPKTKSSFEACSNYPKCRYIKPVEPVVIEGEKCPTCGKEVVEKVGRFGKYRCCIDYPKCKTIIK